MPGFAQLGEPTCSLALGVCDMNDYRLSLAENYRDKSTEELIVLHGQGTLTETAYSVLETELGKRGIASPKRSPPKSIEDTQSLRAHWEGRASLASAFWLVGGGANFFFIVFLDLVSIPFSLGIIPTFSGTTVEITLYVIWCCLIAIVPLIFAYVCVWRCSSNTSWRGWSYLARAALILNLPVIVFMLAMAASAMQYQMPKHGIG